MGSYDGCPSVADSTKSRIAISSSKQQKQKQQQYRRRTPKEHCRVEGNDGDLVTMFYVPALECGVRYDRLTGYFRARALMLAARGLEGLIRNGGRRRPAILPRADREMEAVGIRGRQNGGDHPLTRLPPPH